MHTENMNFNWQSFRSCLVSEIFNTSVISTFSIAQCIKHLEQTLLLWQQHYRV